MWQTTKCKFCGENFVQEDVYTRHMHRYHANRPDFRMDCGHRGCTPSFQTQTPCATCQDAPRSTCWCSHQFRSGDDHSGQDSCDLNASDRDASYGDAFAGSSQNNENNMEVDTAFKDQGGTICQSMNSLLKLNFWWALELKKLLFQLLTLW